MAAEQPQHHLVLACVERAAKNWPLKGLFNTLKQAVLAAARRLNGTGNSQAVELDLNAEDAADSLRPARNQAPQGFEMRKPVADAFVEKLTGGSEPGRKTAQPELEEAIMFQSRIPMGPNPFLRGKTQRREQVQPEELHLYNSELILLYPEETYGFKPCCPACQGKLNRNGHGKCLTRVCSLPPKVVVMQSQAYHCTNEDCGSK